MRTRRQLHYGVLLEGGGGARGKEVVREGGGHVGRGPGAKRSGIFRGEG